MGTVLQGQKVIVLQSLFFKHIFQKGIIKMKNYNFTELLKPFKIRGKG
jgi:hypothetical protein